MSYSQGQKCINNRDFQIFGPGNRRNSTSLSLYNLLSKSASASNFFLFCNFKINIELMI